MNTEKLLPFLISPESTVVDALQKLDRNGKRILFVTDPCRRLIGVLTDGDIRRWLIKTGELQGMVKRMMNQKPKVIYRKDASQAQEFMLQHIITALPVINSKGIILDIVFREETANQELGQDCSLKGTPVVIMAGGKGTRLYPYTKILPKPLIPIGDIPIMERIINRFLDFGVQDFFATVNYRKNMIKAYFAENSAEYSLSYVEEEKPLGTAGSLRLLTDRLAAQPFIVTNCDILIHADYGDIFQYHQDSGNELTIVTALKNIVVPYGVVHSRENGAVCAMEEKPKLSYFVNTGMYILGPGLIQEIPEDTFFHMTDLADKLMAENRKVGMYPISEDSFLDMGEFEEMRRMEQKLNLQSE